MLSISLKLIATTLAVIAFEKRHNRLVRPQTILKNYDYIVVGAGGSGAVVAKRLAEDMTKTVLLLEAGGPQNSTVDAPALMAQVMSHLSSEWNYPLVPQKNAYLSRVDGQLPILGAKSFGGSTVHNGLVYYRDSPESYQLWDSMFGIKNWTFSDVLPYFLKSENNLDQRMIDESPGYHISGGLWSISTQTPTEPILQLYINKSAFSNGAQWTYRDGRYPMGINNSVNSGITVWQRNVRNGIRQSTATAFLENNIRPNLQTIGFSIVTKVLFDSNKRAIGVKFRRFDVWHTIYARREVIVSAGAVGSPNLLLLSGIGPKEHLKSLGIPIISDISVGSSMNVITHSVQEYDIINQSIVERPELTLNNMYDMYVKGKGPLTIRSSAFHCFKSVPFRSNHGVSNGCIEVRTLLLSEEYSSYLVSGRKLRQQWEDYYRPYIGHTLLPIYAFTYRALTNGTIRLNTTDPFANPLIDPCVYCNPQDLQEMIKTFRTSIQFFENKSIKQYIRRFRDPIPSCTPCPEDWYCYDYIKCLVQTTTESPFFTGTNRMGSNTDPNAVVDNRFRVKGVKGLRVIDSSVIPFGYPWMAVTVMLAERGAHIIQEDNENTKPLIIITTIRDELEDSYNLYSL